MAESIVCLNVLLHYLCSHICCLEHYHTNAIRESVYGILLSGCLKNTAGNLGL